MIINKPYMCTKLIVFSPKYSTKHGDYGEPVALLHKGKVYHSSPVIIVEFPFAKSLVGQRFCITREYAQKHETGTNGKAEMLIIPMSHFDTWASASEIVDTAEMLWPS